MPKREKTPPPGDDEPKFLSIYYPWPPYVTLEEEKETIQCARWLACFIGKENLYAMFHKPSSPNTIIIEINHELTNTKMRNILGEHDWEKVFASYDVDEGITHSQVFYSTFQTRREVEKTGWKIVEVKDDWFRNFNPAKGSKVKHPYPKTTFCEPPSLAEEVNALVLFRHLPRDIFPEAKQPAVTESTSAPPPPAAPPPRIVPGSGGAVGASSSGAGTKGKIKGKAEGADPTLRPTAPLARTAEMSAKAKAIHNKPAGLSTNAYEEDSDGDEGYGNYAMRKNDSEDEDMENTKNDMENAKNDMEKLGKDMESTRIEDKDKKDASTQQYKPISRPKAPEENGELCPTHKKRCKPGICEWAADQRRLKKLVDKRTGGRMGQNQRRW